MALSDQEIQVELNFIDQRANPVNVASSQVSALSVQSGSAWNSCS